MKRIPWRERKGRIVKLGKVELMEMGPGHFLGVPVGESPWSMGRDRCPCTGTTTPWVLMRNGETIATCDASLPPLKAVAELTRLAALALR